MAAARSLTSWTDDVAVEFFDPLAAGDYQQLIANYGSAPVLQSVIYTAVDRGARAVVAEHRYLDADYRSEHSAFYSTTFRRYPSVAHRLHFFDALLADADFPRGEPPQFPTSSYLGYSVVRPIFAAPVGRTLLRPSRDLEPHVSCAIDDRVNLFGSKLTVRRAAPFMSQDTQLGVCVHVTAWVVSYYHHHRFQGPRWMPSEIASATPLYRGRRVPAPTEGLTIEQLTGILDTLDLPPIVYRNDHLGVGEDVFSIACRYLNSGLPVIAAGGNHAFVLVGYRRVESDAGSRIEFIKQDDNSGPYKVIEDPNLDDYAPWDYLVVPLPRKLYVSGEKAELAARAKVFETVQQSVDTQTRNMWRDLASGEFALVSTALLSNEFKETAVDPARALPSELAGRYQWMHMARWIWVVEVVDSAMRDRGEPCVVGEVLIDATDHTGDLRPIAWRIGGRLHVWNHDLASSADIALGQVPHLPSVSRVDSRLLTL